MKLLVLLIALLASNAFAEELTGMGILKIGSSKEQIQALMKKHKVKIWPMGLEEAPYKGWDFTAYGNVPITPNIKMAVVRMSFHNNKLYSIEAQDTISRDNGNELFAGFVHKYGRPVLTTETEIVPRSCGEDGQEKMETDRYEFNEKNNISAVLYEITVYDLETNQRLGRCSYESAIDDIDGRRFFHVIDNATHKIADELQAIQDIENEKTDIKERFKGL